MSEGHTRSPGHAAARRDPDPVSPAVGSSPLLEERHRLLGRSQRPDHCDADRLEPKADVLIPVIVSSGDHVLATHKVNRQLLDAPSREGNARRHRHGNRPRPGL